MYEEDAGVARGRHRREPAGLGDGPHLHRHPHRHDGRLHLGDLEQPQPGDEAAHLDHDHPRHPHHRRLVVGDEREGALRRHRTTTGFVIVIGIAVVLLGGLRASSSGGSASSRAASARQWTPAAVEAAPGSRSSLAHPQGDSGGREGPSGLRRPRGTGSSSRLSSSVYSRVSIGTTRIRLTPASTANPAEMKTKASGPSAP